MQNQIKKFIQKPFLRNVFTVVSGTAVAQAITMVFSPIITRVYGPDVYGIFGVYLSVTTILVPIAALTYPTAIVLPKKEAEAKGLAKLSFYITLCISIIFLILLLFFGRHMINIFNIKVLGPFLLFIPLMMLFDGIFQILQQWLIRKKFFEIKAKVTVRQSLILNISYASFGFLNAVPFTLICINTLGKWLYALMLSKGIGIRNSINDIKKFFRKTSEEPSLKELVSNYSDFPKYRAPQVLIHGISENLPILILAAYFNPATVAYYTIGVKVLGIPTQLIGNAVGDVFYPRISEAANNGENIRKLLVKANLLLAGVGIIPFGIIILFGPQLFAFVYGYDWSTAGEFASWLALWSYFMFMTRPTIKILPVLKAQRFHLFFTILMIGARLMALFIGIYLFKDALASVILFSIVGAILYIYLGCITIMKSNKYTYSNK